MTSQLSTLTIPDISFVVHLGWPDAERVRKQNIKVDIKFFFTTPPLACENENLELTICYHTLIQHLEKYLAQKKYKLIEFLACDIYKFLKNIYPATKINVRIKKFPSIANLSNGVSFFYGDEAEIW